MSHNIRSALIAGAIALVIYVVIATLTGQDFGPALGFGVALGVFTAVVSFVIYQLIARSKQPG